MNKYGIREGQEVTLLFYRDQEFLGACIIRATTAEQVGIALHYYRDDELLVLKEMSVAASGAISFEMDKPKLRDMVAARIAELNAMSEDEEGVDPPAPSSTSTRELPF